MGIAPLLPGPLGFGTAPLGNMFRAIPDAEAAATVEAAWDHGIRYFDTAPFYGAGLAEMRLGEVLAAHPRDAYVLSTKVGRLVLDEAEDPVARDLGEKGGLFEHGRPNRMVNDYTADATMRSIEDSLLRLRTDRLDIVWVHDIAQDFYGDEWLARYETARTGAFRVLEKLRAEGVIKAWGLGVNRVEPLELTLDLDEPTPDAFLLAGRYTLLDHDRALQRLMPRLPSGTSTSSSADPTARESWPEERTSNTGRHPPRSSARWSGSRPSPSGTTSVSRRPPCSSPWHTGPPPLPFPVPPGPAASRRTSPR